MTADFDQPVTRYRPPGGRPLRDDTYRAYRTWPTPLPQIDDIENTLDTLNKVVATDAPPPPPAPTPAQFLRDPAGTATKWATAVNAAAQFSVCRSAVAVQAAEQYTTAVAAHTPAMHERINDSWKEWAPKLLAVDLDTPNRLTSVAYHELTDTARNALDEASTALAILTAVVTYTRRHVAHNANAGDYEVAKFVTFDSFDTFTTWREGIGIRGPLNGEDGLVWALRAGGTPDLIASRADWDARLATLTEWRARRARDLGITLSPH